MDNLTNDAKFLLSSMYKIYLEERKNGALKADAMDFTDVTFIHKKIMPEWKIEDVSSTCYELKEKKFIKGQMAPIPIYMKNIALTTDAIACMENLFKDKVDNVFDYLAKIKNAIPFL